MTKGSSMRCPTHTRYDGGVKPERPLLRRSPTAPTSRRAPRCQRGTVRHSSSRSMSSKSSRGRWRGARTSARQTLGRSRPGLRPGSAASALESGRERTEGQDCHAALGCRCRGSPTGHRATAPKLSTATDLPASTPPSTGEPASARGHPLSAADPLSLDSAPLSVSSLPASVPASPAPLGPPPSRAVPPSPSRSMPLGVPHSVGPS